MTDRPDYDKSATPTAHKTSHQDGGSDELSVEGLAGMLAEEQASSWILLSDKPSTFAPEAHKTSHQDGGSDEITVEGLAGELTAEQKSSWAKVSGKPLTETALSTGFSVEGGTTPKKLTVLDTMTLALGAANLKLFMNAAGNALEWAVGVKLGTFFYNTATESGTQEITGVGFKPSDIEFLAHIAGTPEMSIGFDDGTNHYCVFDYGGATPGAWDNSSTYSIALYQSAASVARGKVTTLGADGFTITWVKNGSKIGTATIFYRAKR